MICRARRLKLEFPSLNLEIQRANLGAYAASLDAAALNVAVRPLHLDVRRRRLDAHGCEAAIPCCDFDFRARRGLGSPRLVFACVT